MNNDITKLLGITDAGIRVLSVKETTSTRTIELEKIPGIHYCHVCGCRMYSKGIYRRRMNHPVMQDGLALILLVKQRRWECINPDCRTIETDEFSFVGKHRRNTNFSDLLIVQAFKNPCASAADIARRFHVSDTHAITTFARYVDMPRRQLTEAVCVDEVHLGISKQCNYALVLQDFVTGEPLDMVINRREEITLPYFASIPVKERSNVKYLISDMYKPYLEYVDKYFPNAVSVVDAFHVIKHINGRFLQYIRKVIRRLDDRDHKDHERREQEFHRHLPFRHSKDYYVLKKYHWLLLKNKADIKYRTNPWFDKRLNRMMTTFDYEEWVMRLDPNFREMHRLKEQYITFNRKYSGDPKGARKALPEIISLYRKCDFQFFNEVADTLQDHTEQIINSFILIERVDRTGKLHESRLSNGPMESLNRIPKDMRRIGRGFLNFEHIRNRFLYSQRQNASILAMPKTLDELYLKNLK